MLWLFELLVHWLKEDEGIRDLQVSGVQMCALSIYVDRWCSVRALQPLGGCDMMRLSHAMLFG